MFTGSFPPTLRHLRLEDAKVSREAFNLLPNSLTSLTVSFAYTELSTSIGWELPSSRKKLKLKQWCCDGLAALPNSLTVLHITDLRGALDSLFVQEGGLIEQLPPNLVVLELAQDGIQVRFKLFPMQRISHLRELKPLNLFKLGTFTSEIIRELPTGLDMLILRLKSLKEKDAPFLPPNITKISFGYDFNYNKTWLGKYWPLHARAPPNELKTALRKRHIKANR